MQQPRYSKPEAHFPEFARGATPAAAWVSFARRDFFPTRMDSTSVFWRARGRYHPRLTQDLGWRSVHSQFRHLRRVRCSVLHFQLVHHGTLFVGPVEDERRRGREEPRVDDRGPCRFKGKRIDGGAWDWERSCTEAEIEVNEAFDRLYSQRLEELREEFGDIVIDKGACIHWSNFPTTGPTAPVTDCRDTEDSRAIQAFSSVSDCFDWKGAPQLFKVALGRNTNTEIGILLKHDDLGMRVDRIAPESPADVWNAACELS